MESSSTEISEGKIEILIFFAIKSVNSLILDFCILHLIHLVSSPFTLSLVIGSKAFLSAAPSIEPIFSFILEISSSSVASLLKGIHFIFFSFSSFFSVISTAYSHKAFFSSPSFLIKLLLVPSKKDIYAALLQVEKLFITNVKNMLL